VAPQVAKLLTNLGAMYLYLDRKQDAEDAFRRSVDQAPNELAYLNLGTLAFSAGDYRKALNYYEKARDLRPRNDVTWRNIADCYAMLGEPARVKESFSKAAEIASDVVRTNPTRSTTWMNLAFYEAKLGHAAQAETALRTAEARGSSDLPSQFKRVQVLALLGRREDAFQLLLKCLENGLSPADIELALDLKDLRNDRRYRDFVARKKQP
jgi:tetratricopeptide (TPR) repeat protein